MLSVGEGESKMLLFDKKKLSEFPLFCNIFSSVHVILPDKIKRNLLAQSNNGKKKSVSSIKLFSMKDTNWKCVRP